MFGRGHMTEYLVYYNRHAPLYGVCPVDFAGVRQNPLTQPLYMMVVQILVARLSYDNSML